MAYEDRYKELVELSHSENTEIKEMADAWLISIGLQGAAELKVSTFLLDVAIRNVKSEITCDEVSQLLNAHYANMPKTETNRSHGLDGDYEIAPPDSPPKRRVKNTTANCARLCMLNWIRKSIARNYYPRTLLKN